MSMTMPLLTLRRSARGTRTPEVIPVSCVRSPMPMQASLWRFRHFFFQAEDGIRDTSVTGVQTCALPICLLAQRPYLRAQPLPGERQQVLRGLPGRELEVVHQRTLHREDLVTAIDEHRGGCVRSEERRVGKGGRGVWGRDGWAGGG